MVPPFKIPKKKSMDGDDSRHQHIQSPLSRLQRTDTPIKRGSWDGPRGNVAAGNRLGSAAHSQRSPTAGNFRNNVRALCGLSKESKAASTQQAADQHATQGQTQHRSASQASPSLTNGWRPNRASDRLNGDQCSSPQLKSSSFEFTAKSDGHCTVKSVDTLSELRDARTKLDCIEEVKLDYSTKSPSPGASSQQDVVLPPQARKITTGDKTDSGISPKSATVSTNHCQNGRKLNRTPRLANGGDLSDNLMESERHRWRMFKDRRTYGRSSLSLRRRTPKQTKSSEPIVLSSEEELENEDERVTAKPVFAEDSHQAKEDPHPKSPKQEQKQCNIPGKPLTHLRIGGGERPPPTFLQLEFFSLYTGLTCLEANGKMTITENGINLPLKGVEEGEVTMVASQTQGYGLWDGALAQDGSLMSDLEGPAPSLLFLCVTDSQAKMLHRELSAIQPAMTTDPWCCFLLLVLKEQLPELQVALLLSILEMEEYRKGYASSTGGPTSALDWADGLLLLHSCPAPMDHYLLRLLGHSRKRNTSKASEGSRRSSSLQQFPSRLIQYPAPPCKGRITVTKEDLDCLDDGEFLNDVIIDFYLKYLLLEGEGGAVAERSHVFSSFFFKQLSRQRAAGEDRASSFPDRHTRHQRVKTWTRHVDIFIKDFLFVPVNQEAHWYLVVLCFPGLEEAQHEKFHSSAQGGDSRLRHPAVEDQGRRVSSLRSQQLPECTRQGWRRDTVMKRPCILVMDSLKLSYHENVCRLLREYLQVEWEVRRGTPRLFTRDSMVSINCRVPLQDNSSDCGLYLLQYVESFLKNPIVNFDLPLRLDGWFPRQQVRQKRREIRDLVMKLHESQQ